MAYEPLTFNKFKQQLSTDHYENVSGARRAVGKAASFTPEEKEKAHKLINSKFGEESKPAKPEKKAAKAPKAPKAEAKSDDAPRAPKTRGKGKKSLVKAAAPTSEEQNMLLAERIINAATASLTALNGVRDEKETKGAVVAVIADATALLASGIAAARGIVAPSVPQPMNGHSGKATLERSLPAD